MITICKDTTGRGTIDNPQFVAFLRHGHLPAQELWLEARNEKEAEFDVVRRFPELRDETFIHKS